MLTAATLSAQYETLIEAASGRSSKQQQITLEIDSSDDDDKDTNTYTSKPAYTQAQIPRLPSKPAQTDEIEEVEDPVLAALAAKARARRRAEEASKTSELKDAADAENTPSEESNATVLLFISSEIPNTRPLMVKCRVNKTLEQPRREWLLRQIVIPQQLYSSVFLTWKGNKLFDSTKVERLGVSVNKHGGVSLEGDNNIYMDDDTPPKIHVEAWTEELFENKKKQEAAEEEEARKRAAAAVVAKDLEPLDEPEPEVQKIRLTLKAKDKEDFRIFVKPVRSHALTFRSKNLLTHYIGHYLRTFDLRL